MVSQERGRARARLVAHLAGRIERDGAVRDTCASRVLESALLLTLLRDMRAHQDSQDEIVRFLKNHPAPPSSFDRLMITAALGGNVEPGKFLAGLDGFEHFSAPRKQLMLGTILATVTGARLENDPQEIQYGNFASWVDLSVCAIRLLHLSAREQRTQQEVAFLEDRLAHGSSKPVFEGHLLAHLLALIALNRAGRCHRLVQDGVMSLLACQNPDGGLPFINGFEIFCTATAGLALLDAPEKPLNLEASLGDYLASQQQPSGGWGYAQDVRQCDVDDTAYCVQFLAALNTVRYAAQITAGQRFLRNMANPDGGFPTFFRGHPSEIAMTAGAVSALGTRGGYLAEAAVQYLLRSQKPSGAFECSWSLSESNAVYRVLHALNGAHKQAATLAAGYLMTTQNPDGGWGQRPGAPSDPISTSYALLATRYWKSVPAHCAGVRYLLGQQRRDGGFLSPPDQAAPRPLPYDVPVLADICALRALNGTTRSVIRQRARHPAASAPSQLRGRTATPP